MSDLSSLATVWSPEQWRQQPISQEVVWPDVAAAGEVIRQLAKKPPLIFAGEARRLETRLAAVAQGEAVALIAGDCAEHFDRLSADRIRDQLRLLLQMSLILSTGLGLPTVKIGRLAGQFAKPRSSLVERTGDHDVDAFRGHLINSEFADPVSRKPDPTRLLEGYSYSAACLNLVRAFLSGGFADLTEIHQWNTSVWQSTRAGKHYEALAARVDDSLRLLRALSFDPVRQGSDAMNEFYTAHEALVLDYESSLTRRDSLTGRWYDCSAHLLWLGERTRSLDGAHVDFVRGIANPVGVKLGPTASADDVAALLETLDPKQTPGRLTLMFRLGVDHIEEVLPRLLEPVRTRQVKPVLMVDPMHGNTRATQGGRKTRDLASVIRETLTFRRIVTAAGLFAGGIHLETTPEDVTECVGLDLPEAEEGFLSRRYESLCDPRLNGAQSLEFASAVAVAHMEN